MKRLMRIGVWLLSVLLCLIIQLANYPLTCRANDTGTSAFTFLSIGEGARPVGMGEAYTALAEDVNSIYWNPAGLGSLRYQEVTAAYLNYIVDTKAGYLGYALPLPRGGLGIGIIYLDHGNIEATTADDLTGLSTYRPYDIAGMAAYGCRLNQNLGLGINAKMAYEDIQGYTAHGVAVDFGIIYDLPMAKDLSLGFTVKNLGFQTKAFIEEKHALPLVFALGLGYRMFSDSLRWGLDIYQPVNGKINMNAGGEYCWQKLIAVRLGYRSMAEDLKTGSGLDGLTGFSGGLGVNLKLSQSSTLALDYAFVPFNELGYTHRVSLGMKWGEASIKHTPSKYHGQSFKPKKRNGAGIRHYNQGRRHSKKARYSEAIKQYKQALQHGYKTADVYLNLGYCYHKSGRKAAAWKYYQKALKLDPKNKTARNNLRLLTKR